MNLIETALRVAIEAHKEQKRKSDGFPYIVHPFMVAMKVREHGFSDTVVAAALCHDVLEDTKVSADELRAKLGDEVVALVQHLSEDKAQPWEERKRAYIEHVAAAAAEVKAISTADKIHNLEDSLRHFRLEGPDFWRRFTRGLNDQRWFYQTFVDAVGRDWQHPLLEELRALVAEFQKD